MASMCSFVGLAAGFLLLAPLLRSQADAANLVVNGGFEAGTAGFTSGYSYVPPTPQSSCYPEGTYTVGGNPNDCHNLWASFSPHTGSGMMIVNGASTAGVNVWQENGIAVSPDTNYLFSVWIASNYPTSSRRSDVQHQWQRHRQSLHGEHDHGALAGILGQLEFRQQHHGPA